MSSMEVVLAGGHMRHIAWTTWSTLPTESAVFDSLVLAHGTLETQLWHLDKKMSVSLGNLKELKIRLTCGWGFLRTAGSSSRPKQSMTCSRNILEKYSDKKTKEEGLLKQFLSKTTGSLKTTGT